MPKLENITKKGPHIAISTDHSRHASLQKKIINFLFVLYPKNIWPSLSFFFFQNRERPLLVPLTCIGTGFPEGIVDKMGYR